MKKRFTEEQIIGFLREADAGLPVKELCRKHGVSVRRTHLEVDRASGKDRVHVGIGGHDGKRQGGDSAAVRR